MPVAAGSRAHWHCGECRVSGIGERFRGAHSNCKGRLEQLQFTGINSSPAPDTLDDILKEINAAKMDDDLRVPELDFVLKILEAVGSIDVSGLSDGTGAPTHKGVNSLARGWTLPLGLARARAGATGPRASRRTITGMTQMQA